ncbi:MAG: hypothetical protein ACREIU_05250, partial [Planctomycetota bacterium]
VEVERARTSVVEVEGARIEARGPAVYVARLWDSKDAFERGSDARTREWAVGTGMDLAAWPILEVAAVSGSVTVRNEWGRVTAAAGEVVFAPTYRSPLLLE